MVTPLWCHTLGWAKLRHIDCGCFLTINQSTSFIWSSIGAFLICCKHTTIFLKCMCDKKHNYASTVPPRHNLLCWYYREKNKRLVWIPLLFERKVKDRQSSTNKMTTMTRFTEGLRQQQLPGKVRRRFTAEKLVHYCEALVVKTYCHVLPGWVKIGATGGTSLPLQKSSAKWAGHLAGPGLVNMIRELWVRLNKRPQAVGQLSKNKFFILDYHSKTPSITLYKHVGIHYTDLAKHYLARKIIGSLYKTQWGHVQCKWKENDDWNLTLLHYMTHIIWLIDIINIILHFINTLMDATTPFVGITLML